MSSIFILKEIMDLLYEESKRGELVTTDVENRLRNLEKRLEEKNKELAKLYTENIRLENVLRRYEKEFETLSKMPVIPFEPSVTPPSQPSEPVEYNEQVEPEAPEENTVEQEVQQTEPKKKRKVTAERREYMKEYLHNYRKNKSKAEKEMNINV